MAMKRLQSVLSRYAGDSFILGTTPELDLEGLKTELQVVIKKDKKSVVVRLIIILIIAVAMVWAILYWRNNPQAISFVLGGSGITLSWLVKEVYGLSEEKTASTVILVLVRELNPDNSKSIVTVLSKRIDQ
jgi:hypothetical protein